ncbi:polyprenyl synthetase family protein [Leucobacter sp. W1153]|uniref:polyprenyl synthetase family protein n=1 Tax=unclassified Leucobacter TaxID=2621730 RepID=UPI003F3098D1
MTAVIGHDRTRAQLRAAVERELSEIFAAQTAAAEAYGSEFTHLWGLAAEHVLGGKLVRPVLMVEIFDALAAESAPARRVERESIIRLAAAIELLHYSFLLHDDVIDGDLVRRGRRNLIGALLDDGSARGECDQRGALHWARTGGILMGDLLLATTHQIFARVELPQTVRIQMLDLLEHTITESIAGEQLDVGLSDGLIAPDLSTVLTMSAHKTATYTFELPMRAAAILAQAPQHLERSLTAAGYHLGLAFQLQDDLISTFGDPELHGKDPFSDLREGKQTAIISYARMTTAWPTIESEFGNPELTEKMGARMRALLTDCGAEKFVRGLVEEQTTALYEVLAGAGSAYSIAPGARRVLLALAAELEERRS